MRLLVDTSDVSFTVGRPFEPKTDQDGVQRREKRRDGRLLWVVQLIAMSQDGAETLNVTVAGNDNPPAVTQGQSVQPHGLEAIPWGKNNSVQVAYRAESISAVTATKSSASSAS